MSLPFGGHPTLGQYMAWATKAGCTVKQGVVSTAAGRAEPVVKITSPDGERWVIVSGMLQDEYLMPTTIARLDRRLGMKSEFFSLPGE